MKIDDTSLGPKYPKKNQYTVSQLTTFTRHLARLRFNFTENAKWMEKANPVQFKQIRSILFDNNLLRAQLLISRGNISKNVLLRTLQNFITILKKQKVSIDYQDWFFTIPVSEKETSTKM